MGSPKFKTCFFLSSIYTLKCTHELKSTAACNKICSTLWTRASIRVSAASSLIHPFALPLPYQSEEPKVQINIPPPRWPTITNLTSSRGTFLSLCHCVSLFLSHTHTQTVFPVFSQNLCLSVLQRGQNPSAANIKTEILKKKMSWKEKLPSFSVSSYDASLSRFVSLRMKNLWLSAAVSEHYTHIQSIKEVVSSLLVFHEKLEVFENLKQKTHVSLFIICIEQRLRKKKKRGKERERETLSIIFDISQKSCFPPLLLNKPAKICMELINGSRCGAFKSVSFE